MAKSLLIKDTTVSERAQIVSVALGADGDCEGFDPLVPNAFVTAELNQGEPGNLDPYVAVFYGSDKYFVWFSIQDGEMTEFTMCDSNETV